MWADALPDGSPPNNWVSVFGGAAWTWDETTQQFYLHNFLPEQPDLNWWNEEVRSAFDDILRFWFDRGIAGFRIDVAHGIVKDRRSAGQPARRRGRRCADPCARTASRVQHEPSGGARRHPPVARDRRRRTSTSRILVGETWVADSRRLMLFYGDGTDELHLALNVPFVFAELGRRDACDRRAGGGGRSRRRRGRRGPARTTMRRGSRPGGATARSGGSALRSRCS